MLRRPTFLISLFCLGFSILSYVSIAKDSDIGLLKDKDFNLEIELAETGPAIGSALGDPNPWESYDQWLCFNSRDLTVSCTHVKYPSEWKSVPHIRATIGERILEFDLYPDTKRYCVATVKEWAALLEGTERACIFGAYLQSEADFDLWYLSLLKTDKGYWGDSGYFSDFAHAQSD